MGCCSSVETPIRKEGRLWTDLRSHVQPLDLISVKGSATFSYLVLCGTSCSNSETEVIYSHNGIVVTSEILDLPEVIPGKLYILESVQSEHAGPDAPPDVYGRTFQGTQLRDLDAMVEVNDGPNANRLSWTAIKEVPYPRGAYKEAFTRFFHQVNGTQYETNPCNLLAACLTCARPFRDFFESFTVWGQRRFCSEVNTMCYQALGILPQKINPHDVLPQDLVYPAGDADGLPNFVEPPVPFTTERHYF